jgi:hypothetical protein
MVRNGQPGVSFFNAIFKCRFIRQNFENVLTPEGAVTDFFDFTFRQQYLDGAGEAL